MLTRKEIEKIKIKMLKKGFNQTKLANLLFVSSATLSLIFRQMKDFPKAENKLKDWLKEK